MFQDFAAGSDCSFVICLSFVCYLLVILLLFLLSVYLEWNFVGGSSVSRWQRLFVCFYLFRIFLFSVLFKILLFVCLCLSSFCYQFLYVCHLFVFSFVQDFVGG